jgi:hypothetical protein
VRRHFESGQLDSTLPANRGGTPRKKGNPGLLMARTMIDAGVFERILEDPLG